MESDNRNAPTDQVDNKDLVQQYIKANGTVLNQDQQFVQRSNVTEEEIESSMHKKQEKYIEMKHYPGPLEFVKVEMEEMDSLIEERMENENFIEMVDQTTKYSKIEDGNPNRFNWKNKLKKHSEKTNVGRDRNKYNMYSYSTFIEGQLKNHKKLKRKYTRKKKFKCGYCEYKSIKPECVKRHIGYIHWKHRKHKCEHCGYIGFVPPVLEEHNYSAFEEQQLIFHKIIEHNIGEKVIKICKCEFCDYLTSTLDDMESHVKETHIKKNHKCSICDYSSSESKLLKLHIAKEHKVDKTENTLYKCGLCDYTTIQQNILGLHIKNIHLKEKFHKCNFCNYSAFEEVDLKRHNESQHKCKVCNYSTLYPRELNIHKKIHADGEQHECSICSYVAFQRTHLKLHYEINHMVSETRGQTFKCEHCLYTSDHYAPLETHLRTHWYCYYYKCSFCSYSVFWKRHFDNHMKDKHSYSVKDPRIFKCVHCKYSSDKISSLKIHVSRMHVQCEI